MIKKIIVHVYRVIFARPIFAKFNEYVVRLGYSGLGILNYENFKVSGEHYFMHQIVEKKLGSSPIIFDVGANVGDFSIELSNRFPSAKIYSFEPHPITVNKLRTNIDKFNCDNIEVVNRGVSNKCETAFFYDKKDDDGSTHASLYESVIEKSHNSKSVKHSIDLITIDDFIKEENINYIDFMKVDTEGNELNVFKGAENALENKKIGVIQFEFGNLQVQSHTFLSDIKSQLNGYKLFRLLPNAIIPLEDKVLFFEVFAYQNIVAIRRE